MRNDEEIHRQRRYLAKNLHEHLDYLFKSQAHTISSLTTKVDGIFRRGSLATLEVLGISLLVRSLIAPSFKWEASVIGSGLLVFGVTMEYLIWKVSVDVSKSDVETEAKFQQIQRVLDDRLRGIEESL